jgi:hypothetical protein
MTILGKPVPSYHDLYITTDVLPRTSIFDLGYALRVTCTHVAGWELWHFPEPGEARLLAGEYAQAWLVLDVDGHVIADGRAHRAAR